MRKTVLTLMLAAAASISVAADSNGKNYKPQPDDFRVVNGKVYNAVQSTNWISITGHVRGVSPDGVPVKTYSSTPQPAPFGHWAVIKNLPEKTPVEGTHIDCRVMRIGTVSYKGTTAILYDYGLPNTPENRKNGNVASK